MSTSINNGPKITGFTPIAFVGTVATVYDTDNEGNPLVVGSGRNKGKPYVRALLRSSEVRGQSLIITFWDPTDCPEEGDFGVFRLRVGNSGRLEFASFQKDEENEYLERESEVLG